MEPLYDLITGSHETYLGVIKRAKLVHETRIFRYKDKTFANIVREILFFYF